MFTCNLKDSCPHLNNFSCSKVLAENEYWKKRVEHMQRIMKLAEEKIKTLTSRLQELETEKRFTK
ncbi:MAG: hypothetical protein KKD35_01060 [Elusimicrobia bacterium]|nr:hypothetical protein [Elusimicrobiota bacterium]